VKIIGQNHQFLGVNNAIASMLAARKLGHGRGGVFWQTQGSGKSYSMVFFAQNVLRKMAGDWTFVVVTDRVELDDQIAKTFNAIGAVSEAEGDQCHATSGVHLRELLPCSSISSNRSNVAQASRLRVPRASRSSVRAAGRRPNSQPGTAALQPMRASCLCYSTGPT
jgi:hypothetical protein